jgi:hypothetical protein
MVVSSIDDGDAGLRVAQLPSRAEASKAGADDDDVTLGEGAGHGCRYSICLNHQEKTPIRRTNRGLRQKT